MYPARGEHNQAAPQSWKMHEHKQGSQSHHGPDIPEPGSATESDTRRPTQRLNTFFARLFLCLGQKVFSPWAQNDGYLSGRLDATYRNSKPNGGLHSHYGPSYARQYQSGPMSRTFSMRRTVAW